MPVRAYYKIILNSRDEGISDGVPSWWGSALACPIVSIGFKAIVCLSRSIGRENDEESTYARK